MRCTAKTFRVPLTESQWVHGGRGCVQVEVACVNSPKSVVLAGSQEQLDALRQRLPEGTSSSFIPGRSD